MRVTGPDWPTTLQLRAALADVPSQRIVHWGASPCDKFQALLLLYDAGVLVPPCTSDREIASQARMWGRRLVHTQGRDIARSEFVHNPRGLIRSRKWAESEFYVQPLHSLREWRVHCWDGRAFRCGVKMPPTIIDMGAPVDIFPIRSDRLGWQLSYSQARLDSLMPARKPLRDLALRACEVLGVPGGAVDLLESPTHEVFVLEVNTAPSLGPNSLSAWVEVLREWGEA